MKDKVLEIVKQKGPLLPVQISKDINQNVMISSAILGELVSSGNIKFSHTKIGGSPLYYVDGQEAKLQQLYNQLHDTEKKIYDQLKQKKILRDKSLEPAFRVALRQIRDFAFPLEINVNNNIDIFWKWYLSSNEEIQPILKILIEKQIPKPIVKKETVLKPKEKEIKPINGVEEKIEKPIPENELREKLRKELLKELKEELRKEMLIHERKEREPVIDKKEQKRLEKERKKKELDEKDIFLDKIRKYCQQKKIQILNYEIIKRKNEIDLIINVPSAVGNIQYYCKAKNKKKVNDNDLSSAFLKGSQKKLPVLFLATGILIKRTQEKLGNEFRGISFKKINNN